MPPDRDGGLKLGELGLLAIATRGSRRWYKYGPEYWRAISPVGGVLTFLLATMVLWQRACSLLLASVPLIDAAAVSVRGSADGLRVDTTSGTVQGFYNDTAHDVRAFLGVPYAAAPTGSLRFMPPAKRKRSSDVIQATSWPPSCPGLYTNDTTMYTLLPYLPFAGYDEDCLSVNVWTPSVSRIKKNGNKLLPVLVYIYGGSFDQGGTSISTYEATSLVENQNVSSHEIPTFHHHFVPRLRRNITNLLKH